MKRMLAFILALAICGSIAGCGTKPPATESSASDASEKPASSTEQAKDGPTVKYDTPVKLTRAQQVNTATIWPDGDSPENNVWTRSALEQYNIELVDSWSVDNSQYQTKINACIASNDLPDVFTVDNAQLQQLAKSGMILDMAQAYEKNASPRLKEVMDADPIGFDSGKIDGKLMGLSQQHFGVISMFNCLWIRQDWMNKLKLEAPKSMEDLENLCREFTENDPDGNGKADTYGLGVDKNLGQLYQLMAGFGAYPQLWVKDDAQNITFGGIQPEVKTALTTFQDWYQKGIISKEFGVKDGAKINEDLVSGKVGVYVQQSWFGFSPGVDVIKRNGEEAIFMPYAIPSVDGKQAKLGANWPVGSYTVVNKNCKNPEAVIRMQNLYVDKISTDYANYAQNEVGWGASPFSVNDPMADYNQYVEISAAEKSRDTARLNPGQLGKYENVVKWIDKKDPDAVGAYTQVGSVGAYSVFKPLVDDKNYVLTEYRGIATPTMTQKQSSLDTMYVEQLTKMIMGESIDGFEKLVSDWETLGGKDMIKEMNDMAK